MDAVTAGRWGLWLLGQRQHERAQQRSLTAPTYNARSLAARAIKLIAKWHVDYYPGRWRALAEIVGVKKSTAKDYLAGRLRLTQIRRERLVAYLEADLQERLEVIRLLKLPDLTDDRMSEKRRQGLAKAHQASRLKRVKAKQERARRSEEEFAMDALERVARAMEREDEG